MRLHQNIDFTTLAWVKPELDETLRQARQALEAYVEDPGDEGQLRYCATYLHQVQGTLRMVELYGAAMVAEEMEALTRTLVDGADVSDRDEAYTVLMRGIVALPDYLERLQTGHRDIPIVLLPLLNELRGARGERELSESVLFNPDLSRPLPPSARGPLAPLPGPELRQAAEALRAKFQGALLNWLRDDENPATISALAEVCEKLVVIVQAESARRLFWVAAGTLDALRSRSFSADKPLKQALSRVEREIKRLAEDGEAAFRSNPPLELTRQLLYFVAHAPTEHGRIGEIRQVFGLDEVVPTEAELAHARGSIAGHNRALLDTVSSAIKEDLLRVKDALDLHMRTPDAPMAGLEAQVETLDRVADTLGMLGLGVPRRVVQEQRDVVHAVATGQRAHDEGALLDVAGALLYVEASLDDQVARLGQGGGEESGELQLPGADTQKVLEAVAKEAMANFAQARQCFVAFVETAWDHAQLADVPRLLEEVTGALRILEVDTAPDYLEAVRRFTETELLQRHRVPNGRQLDTLADALASLEYFLEALRDRRSSRGKILDVARQSLEQLGYWPLPDLGASTAPTPVAEIPVAAPAYAVAPAVSPIEAGLPEDPTAAFIAAQMAGGGLGIPEFENRGVASTPVAPPAEPVAPVAAAPTAPVEPAAPAAPAPAPALAAPLAAPVAMGASAFAERQAAAAPPAAPAVSAHAEAHGEGGFDDANEDIDDEIREVFLEELQEEIANLEQLLPAWRQHPDSGELLRPIRRVFHTLKGSGRLVGATTLGEFAWKIENMLNRVLDGSRPASPAVTQLVDHAFHALPQLHARLRGERVPLVGLEEIKAVADRLGAGEEAFYEAPAPGVSLDLDKLAAEYLPDPGPVHAPVEAPVVEAAAPVAAPVVPAAAEPAPMPAGAVPASIDAVLFEILKAEVAGHLATVDAWLTEADGHSHAPTDALLRAVHTMSGAFAMTEVPLVTELTGPVEAYIKRALAAGKPASREGVALVAEAAAAIRGAIASLDASTPYVAPMGDLPARARALRDSLPEATVPFWQGAAEAEDAEPPLHPTIEIAGEVDASAVPVFAEAPVVEEIAVEEIALEAPVVEEVAVEAPVADELVIEEIALEAPVVEEVAVEAPVADELVLEEIALEAPVVEEIAVEAPVADELVLEEIALEAPVVEEVAVEALVADELVIEEIALEAPVVEEAAVEAPVVDEITIEEIALEAPVVEEAAVEAPAADELAIEEIALDAGAVSEDEAIVELAFDAELVDAPAEPVALDELADADVAETTAEAGPAEQAFDAALAETIEAQVPPPSATADVDDDTARFLAQLASEIAATSDEADALLRDAPATEASADALGIEEISLDDLAAEAEAALTAEPEAEHEPEIAEIAEPAESEAEPEIAGIAEPAAEPETIAAPTPAAATGRAQVEADPDAPLDLTDIDVELLDLFLEEARDLLDHSDGLLATLRTTPEDRELIVGLQRDLHTLKGGARMAGIQPVGELGHSMESLLEAVAEGHREFGGQAMGVLEQGFDRLSAMVGRIEQRRAIAMPTWLIGAFEALARGEALPGVAAPAPAEVAAPVEPSPVEPSIAFIEAADAANDAAASDDDLPPVAGDAVTVATDAIPDYVEAAAEDDAEAAEAARAEAIAIAAMRAEEHGFAELPATPAAPVIEFKPLAIASVADLGPLSDPIEIGGGEDEDGNAKAPQEQVRIRADLLDQLVNNAGEVAIYRARLEQQLGAFRSAMLEMDATTTRLRDQLRRLEIETEAQIASRYSREPEDNDATFDPLELDRFSTQQQLTRALAESANDLVSLQDQLDDLTRNYETLLLQQSRVSSDLQEGLMRTRMVPFDALVPRLRRVLRQSATETGKQVQLRVEGAQGEMDRNVLDRMTAPLEHMLRNAVAHGLEAPKDRKAAGKDEEGLVRIVVSREGSEVVMKVTDDGRGLDRERIRAKAIERGLLKADATPTDQEVFAFILEAGFSTAESVSRLAGRGVGMDVVYAEIRQLGGVLQITSTPGQGTEFTIRLPFTLAVTQAVFVKIGDASFAVPISSVRGVGRISRRELEAQLASGSPEYDYAGETYAINDLGLLLGHAPAKAADSLQMPLLLVRSGDLRAAICIDQVLGSREIVVKPVGPQVNSIPGIFGATIMGDGRVVVILDVAPLVRRHGALALAAAEAVLAGEAPALPAAPIEPRRIPVVMVVDDSITMRKVTGRVLERHSYEVLTAKDGVDAIEKMAERVPDLMLLDIEMPRMDGYELATHMKADSRLRDVPIVMITSRTGDKHRQRAMDIGVERYLGKPYQEAELMRNVTELLEAQRRG